MSEVAGFSSRMASLDVMRAVAVIMVVLFHVATRIDPIMLDPVARWFLRYGFLGVDVFFPLSGFLITSFLVDRQGPAAIGEFFIRRLFRIVPLYMLAVLLFAVAALVTGVQADLLPRIWVTFSFLTAWFAFTGGPDSIPFTITWSVSVEEFAYITFGLFALFWRSRFLWFLAAAAILPFGLRIWMYAQGFENIYYFPLARIDSIACGGLIALAARRPSVRWWHVGLIAAVLIALRQAGFGPVSQAALFSAVTLSTCTAIMICIRFLPALGGRFWGAMARIGLYSYFVYLMHFFTIYVLLAAFRAAGFLPGFWLMSALAMALTLAAAHLSFLGFEAPLIRYGRTLGSRLMRRDAVARPAE